MAGGASKVKVKGEGEGRGRKLEGGSVGGTDLGP